MWDQNYMEGATPMPDHGCSLAHPAIRRGTCGVARRHTDPFLRTTRLPIHLPDHPICISARLSGGALQTRRRHHHNLARRGSSRRKSSCRQPLVPRLRSGTEGHHHQLFLIATSGLLSFSERPMVGPLFRPDAMPSHSREPRYCWGSSFATRMQHRASAHILGRVDYT